MATIAGQSTSNVLLISSTATNLITMSQAGFSAGDTLDYMTVVNGVSARKIYAIQIDATLSNSDVYLKLFFSVAKPAAIPTVPPDVILRGSATKKVQYTFSTGITWTNNVWGLVGTLPGNQGSSGPSATTVATFLVTP